MPLCNTYRQNFKMPGNSSAFSFLLKASSHTHSEQSPQNIISIICHWRASWKAIKHSVYIYSKCDGAHQPKPQIHMLTASAAYITFSEKPKQKHNPWQGSWIELHTFGKLPGHNTKHSSCHPASSTRKSRYDQLWTECIK